LQVFPALLLLLAAVAAQAQQYTKIVVFGDSLSDTGNDLPLFIAEAGLPIPSPAFDYTLGRFTDGSDTFPPAINYHGVWIEQMAAALPSHPAVIASVYGGTNFAYGFADTFGGTSQFTPLPVFVHNVGLQIDEYMATHPTIDNHTLFVVWAGANNLTAAVPEPNAAQLIVDGAIAQIGNIQRLINAGATQFLVPNLPNLGSVPRFNTSPTDSAAFNQASVLYNATLDTGVSLLPLVNFRRHVTIHRLDVYGLLKNIVAHPANYGLLDVTDSSQGAPVDPDYFLFWDDLHPTTHGHNIVGMTALKLIEPPGCVQQVAPGEYVGVAAPGCR
jgi:phospholipase/lecithinase/hemolysin